VADSLPPEVAAALGPPPWTVEIVLKNAAGAELWRSAAGRAHEVTDRVRVDLSVADLLKGGLSDA
jgi:hypothetical protein